MDGDCIDENASCTRISDLFSICEVEKKGYVTREDLLRLQDELGLEDATICSAFDQLDTDGSNYLMLDEFVAGCGLFLGGEKHHPEELTAVQADFAFQVFNLIDRDDKGHIARSDLHDAAETLELSVSDVDEIFENLKTLGAGDEFVIRFEDFANEIDYISSRSYPLQEIRKTQGITKPGKSARTSVVSGDSDGKFYLQVQAGELFRRCDEQQKDYVTKNDLQGFMQEFSLSSQQVETVFKTSDDGGNGLRSLDKLIRGFASFPGVDSEDFPDPVERESYVRAQELFNLCDTGQKGYITKRDLVRLASELSISEDLAVETFDELDAHKNGFITLNEFIHGFSSFFRENSQTLDHKYFTESGQREFEANLYQDGGEEFSLDGRENVNSRSSEGMFVSKQMSRFESGMVGVNEVLASLAGEVGSVISKEHVHQLWAGVSRSDQMTVRMFEDFLGKVCSEIRAARREARRLEEVLVKKSQTHEEEIKKIYDDIEMSVKLEKARVIEEEAMREKQAREELVSILTDKEKHIQKMLQRQQCLEERLLEVRNKENDLKFQNLKLLKENGLLEEMLNESMFDLQETRSYIHQLQERTAVEENETDTAAVHATQGIHSEHESLLRQLDLLKSMNQKLRDDRDAIEANFISGSMLADFHHPCFQHDSYVEKSQYPSSSTPVLSPMTKQGSVLSMYFDGVNTDHRHLRVQDDYLDRDDEDFSRHGHGNRDRPYRDLIIDYEGLSVEDLINPDVSKTNFGTVTPSTSTSTSSPSSPRHPPAGKDGSSDSGVETVSQTPSLEMPPENPSRVYKIVFVGDSGVGKSSFIHRFCYDDFRGNFSATIGVDFRVKTIKLGKQALALQLWDTAGQERFRSITQQYFRRADGVVVMFDLSCDASFTNVKGWMNSVEVGADSNCTLMLLGNKSDLVDQVASARKVTFREGERVAQAYGGMYFEVSAKSGDGVLAAMGKFAQMLEMHEDAALRRSLLNLYMGDAAESQKRKLCCGM